MKRTGVRSASNTAIASAVTGHPVSQPTPPPARCSPQTRTRSTPLRSASAAISSRRRRISPSENRGYSCSTNVLRRAGSCGRLRREAVANFLVLGLELKPRCLRLHHEQRGKILVGHAGTDHLRDEI